MNKKLVLLMLLVMLAGVLYNSSAQLASPASIVQQTATMNTAATTLTTAQAAAGSSSVCTMTPTGNAYVYITSISLDVAQNGTGTASTNATWTLSNVAGIAGGTLTQYSMASAANAAAPSKVYKFDPPLKSVTPGLAPVLTGPAVAQTIGTCSVSWYQAQ